MIQRLRFVDYERKEDEDIENGSVEIASRGVLTDNY